MGTQVSHSRMQVPASASSVPVLRRAAVEFYRQHCAQDKELGSALALAVTEACPNTVRHAYPDQTGAIDLEMALPQSDTLLVVVVDAGVGIDARTADPGAGFGLKLIEAYSRLTVCSSGRGTRVEMRFQCQSAGQAI